MNSIAQYLFNPLLDTDSYKTSHPDQLPEGLEAVEFYASARGSKGVAPGSEKTIFFGLSAVLQEVFMKPITTEMVDQAEEFFVLHGSGFSRKAWDYVVNECNGYMPIIIEAVPEGMPIATGVPSFYVSCYDEEFVRAVGQLETLLLRVWYPSTVATTSHRAKQIIRAGMLVSCNNLDGLEFKLHDFGSRGVSSPLSAALGGLGHLTSFRGTDTVMAVMGGKVWYKETMAGYSIPASEHSTMTMWGQSLENETQAYQNMINKFGDSGIFACVSDATDIERACDEIWGDALKEQVQKMNAVLVIRPDSGDPVEWLPKLLAILNIRFGSVVNSKGYKVLNNVRLIQGDAVTLESLPKIINAVTDAGFSLDNVGFGMGGGLLQKCDRDTFGWAMKCCAARVDGQWRDVFKNPKTDSFKKSLKGRITTVFDLDNDSLVVIPKSELNGKYGQKYCGGAVIVYEHYQGFDKPYLYTPALKDVREILEARCDE